MAEYNQGKADAQKAALAGWNTNYQKFLDNRLERTQSSAQQWLATITALLGLFSVAVVVGGGKSVTDLPGSWPWVVLFGAVVVYSLALVSVLTGAIATWGGLSRHTADSKELTQCIADEMGMAEDAAKEAEAYAERAAGAGDADLKAAYRELARANTDEAEIHWHQSRLASAVSEVRTTDAPSRWSDLWGSELSTGDAFDYRFRYERQANRRRRFLHQSRIFGILSVVLAGILAVIVLGLQSRSTPSSSFLVVRNGTLSCLKSVPGAAALSGVTQVTVVPHC